MLIWLFLLGITFSFIIPAVNLYLSERKIPYIFYIGYILTSVIFILFTFVKYNNLILFKDVDFTNFFSYERIINSIAAIFYYTFLWHYVENSKRKKAYRKILNRLIFFTFIASVFITILDVFKFGNNIVDIVTLVLSLLVIIYILILCVKLISDKNNVFKIIGVGFLGFMVLVTGSLFIDTVPALSFISDNPHKLYLIGVIFELTLLNYALNLSNQDHIKSLSLEKNSMEGLALRSQMNPHFVHNSLNAIQYYIQRNEVDLSENYLSRFSKLVRLFFEYSRRTTISVSEEIVLLENYLIIEKLRFEDKLSFNINVDEKMDVEEQHIPTMILQPIVENAVNHGLFHKKEKGTVSVNFIKNSENSFTVIIEDDGIGLKKARKIYKNSSKNYQSNSTNVLEERLQLLKQSKKWKIEYSIKDLSDDDNKTGTRVTLLFKINKL
ncbi:7TM protein involved in diverse intracellular signaling [Lutibacter sp. Hel_I_33_5]|uniref:sensor histidine kinase n=1 Tax=Lutibacter sp. Hel_I_33_5 TaxID=1566289 RepID=UPI0011A9A29D|nr:histidine kinase [Lutibacter sp. Hel_I_33_5]TVZ56843.1 7TM protein involved in diverse intracellular signaling [Lutibacter sp. Hel_I_33_5]